MNIYHLIILLVRFLAICLAIYSINSFVFSWLAFQTPDAFSFVSLIIPGSIMLAGVLIWFMPMSVARSITGYKGEADEGSEKLTSEQFSSITFLMLALYLGYRVLSDGTYWLYYYLNYKQYEMLEVGIDATASMYSTVVEAVFLIAMLLGRRGIFHLFRKLRNFS
jgi:hypothetical protein